MSQWLPPEPGRPRTTPRAVTACRCDRRHRDGVLYRREAEYALGHEIYLDPWIRDRSRFGSRSRSIETPAIGQLSSTQRVSKFFPEPGRDVLFWGALCLPYVVAKADRGPRLRRRVGGPASAREAPVLVGTPPPVGALCASQPRTVDLEPTLLDRYDPVGL